MCDDDSDGCCGGGSSSSSDDCCDCDDCNWDTICCCFTKCFIYCEWLCGFVVDAVCCCVNNPCCRDKHGRKCGPCRRAPKVEATKNRAANEPKNRETEMSGGGGLPMGATPQMKVNGSSGLEVAS